MLVARTALRRLRVDDAGASPRRDMLDRKTDRAHKRRDVGRCAARELRRRLDDLVRYAFMLYKRTRRKFNLGRADAALRLHHFHHEADTVFESFITRATKAATLRRDSRQPRASLAFE